MRSMQKNGNHFVQFFFSIEGVMLQLYTINISRAIEGKGKYLGDDMWNWARKI